jgi:hypothetical protein
MGGTAIAKWRHNHGRGEVQLPLRGGTAVTGGGGEVQPLPSGGTASPEVRHSRHQVGAQPQPRRRIATIERRQVASQVATQFCFFVA